MSDKRWFVYMIEADDGSYYTGVTTDVERRLGEHQSGKRGAKYFKGRKAVKVVFVEAEHDRSSACKREAQIKKLRAIEKRRLAGTR